KMGLARIREIVADLDRKSLEAGTEGEASVRRVVPVVKSLLSEKRAQYQERVDLSIQDDLPARSSELFSRFDVTDFKRALSNLIDNAIEASTGKDNLVSISVEEAEKGIFVRVKDRGAGIKPEILPRLMSPGATFGKPGGSGLGLFQARKASER